MLLVPQPFSFETLNKISPDGPIEEHELAIDWQSSPDLRQTNTLLELVEKLLVPGWQLKPVLHSSEPFGED